MKKYNIVFRMQNISKKIQMIRFEILWTFEYPVENLGHVVPQVNVPYQYNQK